ncbi:hypothetical protein PPERSA_00181 [Pseudocohnilembus persalinus]|uniref:Uncharacterized protein n=1 Tax=Pseudocohnilembus persalinus TaxID=266149 RepID=A0A0V0QCR9_PSEPJ|nr:hypothetical protein PPERSA_00181 [Pseudocohnilembus persalinus]|eukprot:KRX00031.1 hypothetical protein PPERSA_00181 [Pseudocohnilembus persalinus]
MKKQLNNQNYPNYSQNHQQNDKFQNKHDHKLQEKTAYNHENYQNYQQIKQYSSPSQKNQNHIDSSINQSQQNQYNYQLYQQQNHIQQQQQQQQQHQQQQQQKQQRPNSYKKDYQINREAKKLQEKENDIMSKAQAIENEMNSLKQQKVELLVKVFEDQITKDMDQDINNYKKQLVGNFEENKRQLVTKKQQKVEKLNNLVHNIQEQIRTFELIIEDLNEKKEELDTSCMAAIEYVKRENLRNLQEYKHKCQIQVEKRIQEFEQQIQEQVKL